MKKIIFLCLIALNSFAQNPYEIFGYKNDVTFETTKQNLFSINNADKSSSTKTLIFDFKNDVVYLVGRDSNIIETFQIIDERFLKWLSIDPKAHKYPGMSPYNFVANNPLNNIDPDGAEIKPLTSSDAGVVQNVLNQYSTLFSATTYNRPVDVGNANGVTGSMNVFTTNTSTALFERRLGTSNLTENQKTEARAIFQVLTSSDIVEIGVITPATNVQQQQVSPNYTPSNATEFRGTTNPAAISLFQNGSKTTESIQSTFLNQPVSGSTDAGVYGFFPQPQGQQTQTPKGGQFVGVLLTTPTPQPGRDFTYMSGEDNPVMSTPEQTVTKAIQAISTQGVMQPR